jgi:hypothetical protein
MPCSSSGQSGMGTGEWLQLGHKCTGRALSRPWDGHSCKAFDLVPTITYATTIVCADGLPACLTCCYILIVGRHYDLAEWRSPYPAENPAGLAMWQLLSCHGQARPGNDLI